MEITMIKPGIKNLLSMIILGVILSACSVSNPVTPTESGPGGAASWAIEMNYAGGFAREFQRTVAVDSSGQMKVTDKKTGESVSARVPEGELKKIAEYAIAATKVQPPSILSSCTDCYTYELKLKIADKEYSYQADDKNMSEQGLESLIKVLMDLQEKVFTQKIK